jgi:hypothetical protein
MNGKLTLSFSIATFIAAIGVLFFLADLRTRVQRLEREQQAPAAAPTETASKPAGSKQKDAKGASTTDVGDGADPLASKDPKAKLDWLVKKLDAVDTRVYEGIVDLESELYQQKRDIGKVNLVVHRILDGLRKSGDYAGFKSSLPEPHKALTPQQRKEYVTEAARWGIHVKEGEVTARGLLNGAQDRKMPIEYFMTRFPENGHETLVHLIGNTDVEEFAEPPYPDLHGLVTALYKALLAAGFQQGQGSHPARAPKTPGEQVPWVLPSGDTVYLYTRWKDADGKTHLARASDWVIDPATGKPLPEDCFKFTGSMRVEQRETGDEMLLAEARGFIASVYPDQAAMIEVAIDSASNDNYRYNWSALPKHDGNKPFYVDLIFRKTPLKK